MTENQRAKAREIRDKLIPIRANLDQLVKQADDEGVRITHQTIQSLVTQKVALEALADEAQAVGNQRVTSEVNKEILRAMQGLGLLPRKRRYG
jgi:hypothetical protein